MGNTIVLHNLNYCSAEEEQKLKELQLDHSEKVAAVEALKAELRHARNGTALQSSWQRQHSCFNKPHICNKVQAWHASSASAASTASQYACCTRVLGNTHLLAAYGNGGAEAQDCEQKEAKLVQATLAAYKRLQVTHTVLHVFAWRAGQAAFTNSRARAYSVAFSTAGSHFHGQAVKCTWMQPMWDMSVQSWSACVLTLLQELHQQWNALQTDRSMLMQQLSAEQDGLKDDKAKVEAAK